MSKCLQVSVSLLNKLKMPSKQSPKQKTRSVMGANTNKLTVKSKNNLVKNKDILGR